MSLRQRSGSCQFHRLSVVGRDMEYFREPRYDAAAVYPTAAGTPSGIQNTLLVGDELRVFFRFCRPFLLPKRRPKLPTLFSQAAAR